MKRNEEKCGKVKLTINYNSMQEAKLFQGNESALFNV